MVCWKQKPWRTSIWLQSILFQSFAKTNHFLDQGSKIYVHVILTCCFYVIYFLAWQNLCSVIQSHFLLQTHPSGPEVRLSTTWQPECLCTSKLKDQSTRGLPWQGRPWSFDFSWFWWNSESLALREPLDTGAYAITKDHP